MAYDFKKLSEVEALTEVPENATVLAEVSGSIKRVPGSSLGGVKTINGNAPDENGNVLVNWDSLDGKPFSTSRAEVLSDFMVTDNQMENPFNVNFTAGYVYEINWGGTVYSCTAFSMDLGEVEAVLLGNQAYIGSEDTGEPFVIMYAPGMMTQFIARETGVTMSITEIQVKKIDSIYLPASHMNFGPTTLYDGTLSADVLCSDFGDYDFDGTSYCAGIASLDPSLVKSEVEAMSLFSQPMHMSLDGEEHTFNFDIMNDVFHYGNLSLLQSSGEDTGEDFCIFLNIESVFTGNGDAFILAFRYSGEYDCTLVSEFESPVPIDSRFIGKDIARVEDIPAKMNPIDDASGEYVTAAEFNNLLAAMREAGLLLNSDGSGK